MNIFHLKKITKHITNAEVTADDRPITKVERRFTEDKRLILNFVTTEPFVEVKAEVPNE